MSTWSTFAFAAANALKDCPALRSPEGDHIDRAHKIALPVIRQKRTRRQSRRVDVEGAETGEIIGQLGERTQLLIVAARRGLQPRFLFGFAAWLRPIPS